MSPNAGSGIGGRVEPTPLADILDGTAKQHPLPGNVLMHLPWFGEDSDDPHHDCGEVRTVVTDVDLAAVVTSLVTDETRKAIKPWERIGGVAGYIAAKDLPPLHRPVIDLDVPAKLVPSTTPGHFHLYIDQLMTWEAYLALLDALARARVVEEGYVRASSSRGHTAVRVPWLHKNEPSPRLPEELRPLVDRIAECENRAEVAALYAAHLDEWGDEHNEAARSVARTWALREQLQERPAS